MHDSTQCPSCLDPNGHALKVLTVASGGVMVGYGCPSCQREWQALRADVRPAFELKPLVSQPIGDPHRLARDLMARRFSN